VREAAGSMAGQPLDVTIELDAAPRTVEAPQDLAAALDSDPALRTAFDALSYSHRKEYVDWIVGAKREATRRQRIERTAVMLRDGVRSPKQV
jgi:uncharacterized protein YdeI (YjbR/CyaY-like superfamily)